MPNLHPYTHVWMEIAHEAPGHRAYFSAMADPRSHRRLPARGRMGPPDAGRPRRFPPAGTADGLGRSGARLLPHGPPALDDPMEARGAARLGRPARRPRPGAAHAPRPAAGGPAR